MAFGSFIGIIFFLLVLLAALTSSISLMETIVSIIVDKLHVERKMATISVIIGVLILGLRWLSVWVTVRSQQSSLLAWHS